MSGVSVDGADSAQEHLRELESGRLKRAAADGVKVPLLGVLAEASARAPWGTGRLAQSGRITDGGLGIAFGPRGPTSRGDVSVLEHWGRGRTVSGRQRYRHGHPTVERIEWHHGPGRGANYLWGRAGAPFEMARPAILEAADRAVQAEIVVISHE